MVRGIQLISVLYERGKTTENILPVQKGGERKEIGQQAVLLTVGESGRKHVVSFVSVLFFGTSTNLKSLPDKIFLKENQLISKRNKLTTYYFGEKGCICSIWGSFFLCLHRCL